MSRHFKAEVLSVFMVGEVRRRKAAKISAHLPTCALCSGVVRELEDVPTLLARAPAPPMPDTLTVRIEIALRTEWTTRIASEPASEAARDQIPASPARTRRRWQLPGVSSPLAGSLAAAAAAVVIAGGGYELASHVGASSSTSSSSSAVHAATGKVPGPVAAPGAVVPAQRVRYGPAVVYREAGQKHSIYSVETGTDYEPGTLATQARATVSAASASGVSYAQNAVRNGGQPATGVNLPKLEACVGNVASGRNVLLVDVAKFRDKPATIIVIGAAPGGPGVVYAVGATCSATSKDILAQQHLSSV